MSNLFYRKEIPKAQWNKIKFLFPVRQKIDRPSLNSRTVFNAILWILKSGARWRDLPAHYGNWNSIYHKFRQCCECGLFARSKVHQSACSALNNQAICSSYGGKNTKIHVLINEKMHLWNIVLTGGQVHDSEKAVDLLEGVNLNGKTILDDKANFRVKHNFDTALYKQRNLVERFFQRIKNYRRIATRYDKLATCFENFVLLAATVIYS